MEDANTRPKPSSLGALCFIGSLFLSWICVLSIFVNFVPSAARQAMVENIMMSVAVLVLLGLSWRRLPRLAKVIAWFMTIPFAVFALGVSISRLL